MVRVASSMVRVAAFKERHNHGELRAATFKVRVPGEGSYLQGEGSYLQGEA